MTFRPIDDAGRVDARPIDETGVTTFEPIVPIKVVYTPSPIRVRALTRNPLVLLPIPATSVRAVTIDPTVELGAVTINFRLAQCFTETADPTVVLGGITITPEPASAAASTVDPTLIQPITIVPEAVGAAAATVDPQVILGEIVITPAPAVSRIETANPVIVAGELTIVPTIIETRALTVDPEVVMGATSASPSASEARTATVDPTVIRGAITLTPSQNILRSSTIDPTVIRGGITITPSPSVVRAATVDPTSDLAFTGAEGYGRFSQGGKGGTTYTVTNLNDSGTGSFRSFANLNEPRIIKFAVSGNIYLSSALTITNPYCTIDGSDAPGPVTISTTANNPNRPVAITGTHDIIVRHIRFRPSDCTIINQTQDAFALIDSSNAIIDHCTFMFSSDGLFDLTRCSDVTVSWCIMAWALYNNMHSNGSGGTQNHSMGQIISNSNNISIHHNLYAHNNDRNPRMQPGQTGIHDIVNNVIYNTGVYPTNITGEYGPNVKVNYVGNYHKAGVNTNASIMDSDNDGGIACANTDTWPINAAVYVDNNFWLNRTGISYPTATDDKFMRKGDRDLLTTTRWNAPQVTTSLPAQAWTDVLAGAGATLPERDEWDTLVVTQATNGTGSRIDHQIEVDWP